MGTNCGAIDAVVTTIRHDLGQGDRNDLPYPGFAPTSEPSIDHIPVTIFWRNIAPWRAAAKTPKYAIDDGTVLFRSTTTPSVRSINRKQGLQNAPLCFAQIASAQACLPKPALNQAGSFASNNLSTPPSSNGKDMQSVDREQDTKRSDENQRRCQEDRLRREERKAEAVQNEQPAFHGRDLAPDHFGGR